MKNLLFICTLFFAFMACRPDEEIISDNPVHIRPEKDTIQFDTLFTSEQSFTKRIKLYNPARESVLLERIGLQKGAQSPYTLYVNGRPGKEFGEQLLLGGDSLLLLLEVQLPPTDDTRPYLSGDLLQFSNKGLLQEVPVLAYGQNATVIQDSVLACNTVWDSSIPYIIEKPLLVDSLCTLTIAKGCRLYFKPGAALKVKGKLMAVGDTAETDRILFRNHRLDPFYKDKPGQWEGISFLPGSARSQLLYCTIRNAKTAILVNNPDDNQQPDLELGYCRIENSLQGGIICHNSDLLAYNTLVNSSAGHTVASFAGGNYTYQHCTFANYFSQRQGIPALYISNYTVTPGGEEKAHPLQVVMVNSIVWGSMGDEIQLDIRDQTEVNIEMTTSLLRSARSEWTGEGNLLNTERSYHSFANTSLYNYRPDSLSPAIDAGTPIGLAYDLSGKPRDEKPDIGALEYLPEPAAE